MQERIKERAMGRDPHSRRGAMDEKSRRSGGMTGSGDDQPRRPTEPQRQYQPTPDKPSADVRLRQILDALPVAVYTTDAAGILTYYNRAAAELVGRQPRVGTDRWSLTWRLYTPDGTPLPLEDSPMAVALKENRAVRNVEVLVERPNGSLVPVMPYPTPITDRDGQVIGGINALIDVTERKRAEAGQLGLLRELNHRVKNNMQMLLSLLSSAARESDTPETRTVLTDAGRRVAVIGAAQQVLYGGDGTGTTFKADALLRAVAAIAAQGPAGTGFVAVKDTDIVLTNDAAVPLALMLNELVSNAARYARSDGRPGSVTVSLTRSGERFALVVADNGPGFDPDFSGNKRASGLGLVRGLARQLGGTLAVERAAGARCTVTFADRSLH
jgi:PAS domain S-box-containing protein